MGFQRLCRLNLECAILPIRLFIKIIPLGNEPLWQEFFIGQILHLVYF